MNLLVYPKKNLFIDELTLTMDESFQIKNMTLFTYKSPHLSVDDLIERIDALRLVETAEKGVPR